MLGPLVVSVLIFWATLMRALFVKEGILPATCGRCGLRFERQGLGDPVCRCQSGQAG